MPMPPWMDTAKSLIGVTERSGSGNNPIILRWAELVGGWTRSYYKRDSIPWCGLFIGVCFVLNGIRPSPDALRAKAWAKWPDGRRLREPCFGSLLVFTRRGGGHVGFYVSEDDNYFHVLGGNQSDAVNIKRISKSRHIATMWPKGAQYSKFLRPGRIYKRFNGKISHNEA